MRQPRTSSIPQPQTHRRLKDREPQTRAAYHETAEVLRGGRVTRRARCSHPLGWAVTVLWLLLSVASLYAQDLSWEMATNAGVKAFEQGYYAEAAQYFKAALLLAEDCMPDDPHLSMSLMNLGIAYYTQGQYAHAAPLYQRALILQEQILGPEHPQLVEVLQANAAVQRKMHPVRSRLPWSTANQLASRARRIQEREAQADVEEPPGVWFRDPHELFGGPEH
jgi:tetratricopeptide (TPR) repeat protein